MIPYINDRLEQWGLWTLGGKDRLGYPRRAAFVQVIAGGPGCSICDEEAMQINRAVQALDGQLRLVVDAFYVRMRSCDADTIANTLKCCRRTLYDKLHRAHLKVMDALQDDELARKY